MKTNTLLFLLSAVVLAFTSCKKDSEVDGCTRCTFEVPFVTDCVVTICEDGTHSDNGATACLGIVDGILLGAESQEEKVEALREANYSCR